MIKQLSLISILSLSLSGCAITQTVQPVERFEGTQVCIIVNPAVSQPGFLVTLARALHASGASAEAVATMRTALAKLPAEAPDRTKFEERLKEFEAASEGR